MVRASGLEWTILRFAAAMPLSLKLDPGMFDVPLANRMEFVHTRDVGLAVANAAGSPAVWGRLLLIGGGTRCQYYYREIVERVLTAAGVGMLPEAAFTTAPFATDWLDTAESQRLLHYQQRDLGDYVREMATALGQRRVLARAFRPLVRYLLVRRSPYFPWPWNWMWERRAVTQSV
jgi:UDP-glucose 4-epimerase